MHDHNVDSRARPTIRIDSTLTKCLLRRVPGAPTAGERPKNNFAFRGSARRLSTEKRSRRRFADVVVGLAIDLLDASVSDRRARDRRRLFRSSATRRIVVDTDDARIRLDDARTFAARATPESEHIRSSAAPRVDHRIRDRSRAASAGSSRRIDSPVAAAPPRAQSSGRGGAGEIAFANEKGAP